MPELNFKGKEFVYNHHLTVPFRPLLPQADKGIGAPALDGNLIIHGDNLHGLKALLPTHAGKVNCAYIDPPYNTGNEGWCYNDNVNSPMIKEWLVSNPIGIEDAMRHDKWCAMMWPRLRLIHELMADESTLFVSIDANEHANIRLILDEIFGDQSLVGVITWESKTKSQNTKSAYNKLQPKTEFIYCYTKGGKSRFNLIVLDQKNYDLVDEQGVYRIFTMEEMNLSGMRGRESMVFDILGVSPRIGKQWQIGKSQLESYIKRDDVYIESGKPCIKMRPDDERNEITQPFWGHFSKEMGTAESAKKELKAIIPSSDFETVKPVNLIERLIFHATDSDSIVLDSFAGSGTTAHAVLAANARDGGNRKFVLVEGENYADNLTAERVRRVATGYEYAGTQQVELFRETLNVSKLREANTLLEKVQRIEVLDGPNYDNIDATVKDGALVVIGERAIKDRAEGLGGTFTYCELGAPIDMDRLLTGADLPDAAAMAALLYHTATAQAFDPASLLPLPIIGEGVMQLGVANGRTLWLIYKPDLEWLKSSEAALTLSRARFIAAHSAGEHLVFASAKFVGTELLAAEKLPVAFAPLPFALYRVETA